MLIAINNSEYVIAEKIVAFKVGELYEVEGGKKRANVTVKLDCGETRDMVVDEDRLNEMFEAIHRHTDRFVLEEKIDQLTIACAKLAYQLERIADHYCRPSF